jgi:hypothetical protein
MRITAEDSAVLVNEKRKYVVIGYPALSSEVAAIGEVIPHWCNIRLERHFLVVESETDRADWDAQVQVIFKGKYLSRNPRPAKSQRFFRCRLEKI